MSRLSKLYQAMETLASEGLKLSAEQEAQLRKAEEEIIQKEILPVLTGNIEPVLSQIEREMVLVVDYVPGKPLRVSLSRDRNLSGVLADAVEIKPDPEVEHRTIGKQKVKKTNIKPWTKLRVTMPDGTVIFEKSAKDSFIEALKQIGIERVRALGLKVCNIPLISNTIDKKYGSSQHPVGGGWYIFTCSSTKVKKKQLDQIARLLHLHLWVKVIEPSQPDKQS